MPHARSSKPFGLFLALSLDFVPELKASHFVASWTQSFLTATFA